MKFTDLGDTGPNFEFGETAAAKVCRQLDIDEASLAQMRDYFTKNDPDSIQIARNNETPLRTKNPEGIPPQIQALVNKMYHAGKISPEEFETLRQFQRKTKINVGIREADKEQQGEQV